MKRATSNSTQAPSISKSRAVHKIRAQSESELRTTLTSDVSPFACRCRQEKTRKRTGWKPLGDKISLPCRWTSIRLILGSKITVSLTCECAQIHMSVFLLTAGRHSYQQKNKAFDRSPRCSPRSTALRQVPCVAVPYTVYRDTARHVCYLVGGSAGEIRCSRRFRLSYGSAAGNDSVSCFRSR